MALYRAGPNDGIAWITGASTGIGRALALHLARTGYTVAATARAEDNLASITHDADDLKGRIFTFPCDVMSEAGMERTVAAIEKTLGPIVLAVFNAGTYLPVRGDRLETTNIVRSYQINVFGTVNGLVPVTDRMRARGFGQIAVMGSVTSFFGMPSAAAYGSTKAALNNMVEGLRFDFEKMNIRTQMINPGFVATPLTDKTTFRMPALLSAEEAAARIATGLERGGYEIAFPRRLVWPLKFLRLFPKPVVFAVMNLLTGWKARAVGPRKKPPAPAGRPHCHGLEGGAGGVKPRSRTGGTAR
ncbi:SDR family NAD(P)-dependent oxidoreductase [Nitratireductor sp. ZSWI3]|uniref:SDR family NAD(P)-dependent oxidoreductase n=1 Tax=Nitratireductor sp. ZSWI3 TaxID=2966359 RepID=UPI00214F8C2C|nr:SDR family NAD(P)-dependent oxidoreductase [Nitratireductor sp. ZSWI3]MCR4268154.1 SDR family NAD(P)-dependent oxidoreductase [Nitratireductor sp. ZSWI3]